MKDKIIKMLNKQSKEKEDEFISTGFYIYFGIPERWTKAFYNGKETKSYISTLGRVYNPKKKIFSNLKESVDHYIRVSISFEDGNKSQSVAVSRMMLESFVGRPPEDMVNPEADHIDNNPNNNALYNLRWLAAKDNVARRVGYDMLPDETIEAIAKDLVKNELTTRQIADKYDTDIKQVYYVLHKRRRLDILDKYDFSHFNKFVLSSPARLDDNTKAEMERLIKEGKPNKEIREALGLANVSSVKDALVYMRRQLGIYPEKPQNQHFNEVQKREVEKYLLEGKGPTAIAKLLGIEYNSRVKNAIAGRKKMLIKQGKLTV